jgi:hypothetical protein
VHEKRNRSFAFSEFASEIFAVELIPKQVVSKSTVEGRFKLAVIILSTKQTSGTTMKILLFLILIIISQQSLACSCMGQTPLEMLARSDSVATVNVLDVTVDPQNKHYNDVKIDIINLYKGKNISALKNYNDQESMCGVNTPLYSKWLIYAYKHTDGYLRYDLCSGPKQIDKQVDSNDYPNAQEIYRNNIKSNLELLEFLKDENIQIDDELGLLTSFSNQCLEDFNGIEIKTHRFALYELTIDSELNIKMIKTLKDFDNIKLKNI